MLGDYNIYVSIHNIILRNKAATELFMVSSTMLPLSPIM
jgi:hypothetical protein